MKKISAFILAFFLFCAVSFCAAAEETVLSENAEIPEAVLVNALSSDLSVQPTVSLQTETFKIKHIPLEMMAEQVRAQMGSSQGGVIVNQESGQLEVSAPEQLLVKIKALIGSLDVERDIFIDVKVVQIDLDEEHFPGINWSAIVSDYNSFMVSEDSRKFSVGTVSQEDLTVLLEALDTVGQKKMFPVQGAKIANASDVDLRLKAFEQNVKVTMDPLSSLDAQASQKQDRYTARLIISLVAAADNAVDLRILSSNGTTMTVHIKRDGVAVIGGIFTQTKSQSTKKFPFLGDLPLVGAVFRDQSKVVHRLENIIFITPRISTPAANAVSN